MNQELNNKQFVNEKYSGINNMRQPFNVQLCYQNVKVVIGFGNFPHNLRGILVMRRNVY